MNAIKVTKSVADEICMKLDGIIEDFEGTEGTFGSFEDLCELYDKLDAHRQTSCRSPLIVTAREAEIMADELDNSADALHENGYKSTANRFNMTAFEWREKCGLIA